MDTPLLNDPTPPDERPYRPRYTPSRDVLHFVTALLIFASSALAYARAHEGHSHPATAPLIVPARAPSPTPMPGLGIDGTVIYADPVGGRLCQDERRRRPDRGAWQCVGEPLATPPGYTVQAPSNPTAHCTHRLIDAVTDAWDCFTHIPVRPLFLHWTPGGGVYVGDRSAAVLGHRPSKLSICTDEIRDLPTWGVWTCTSWKDVPPDQRFAQAVDPGGTCRVREADVETGIWHCEDPAS